MTERTQSTPDQPTPAKQPNRIMNEPANAETCAADRAAHGIGCEGAARDQLAYTRINAAGERR